MFKIAVTFNMPTMMYLGVGIGEVEVNRVDTVTLESKDHSENGNTVNLANHFVRLTGKVCVVSCAVRSYVNAFNTTG